MPRYFFNVPDKIAVRHSKGLPLPDGAAAPAHAGRPVTKSPDCATKSFLPLKVIVTNDQGEDILELSISLQETSLADDPYPYGKCAVCGWHGMRSKLKKGRPGIEHCPKCKSDDTTWSNMPPAGALDQN